MRGCGRDLREGVELSRMLPGPRLLTGMRSSAHGCRAGRVTWVTSLSRRLYGLRAVVSPGMLWPRPPAAGRRSAAAKGRCGGPAVKKARSLGFHVYFSSRLSRGAAKAFEGKRPGNGGRNQTGTAPQGLTGCSGLWCLQVMGLRAAREEV